MSITVVLLQLAAAAVTTDAPAQSAIDEITVTAQKREQALEKVPAAVTVLDRDTLQVRGVSTLADIQSLVPSVRLQKESASTEIYIRGVGSTLDVPMIEPPNAYNINGIYVPREVSSASFVDVDRVEILPGAQGTLYGRGAIGGVINTITRRPDDKYETQLNAEVGNYSLSRVSLTQNLPLGNAAAARATLSYHDHDGYLGSGADSANDVAGLLAVEGSPSDTTDIFVWGHFESRQGYAANLLSKGTTDNPRSQAFPNGDPWDDRLRGDLSGYATLGPVDAQDRKWDTALVGAEFNWAINDHLQLTYLPSYLDFDWHQGYWLTHKNGDFNESIDQRTQELRLAYDGGGALTWLAGLYDYRIETAGQLFIQFGPDELFPGSPGGVWLNAVDVRAHELSGAAAFGELGYALGDRWRLIAGGRASSDERRGVGFQTGIVEAPARNDDPVEVFTGQAPPGYANQASWQHVDWKLGTEFDATANSLLYATLQTGFQPGTFDQFPDTMTRDSELMALTAGIRSRSADGRVTLNDEFFYYVFDNLLTQAFDAATGTNRLTNADVVIYGNQLDLAFVPAGLDDTRLFLSLGYLHARYRDFAVDALDVFNHTQMQNAPDWTANVGVTHGWNLARGGVLAADLLLRFESSYWGDFSHSPGLYQSAYTRTDFAITYSPADRGWSAALWSKNLENQDVQSAAATGSMTFDPGPGAPFLEAPRTYGLRMSMQFGGNR